MRKVEGISLLHVLQQTDHLLSNIEDPKTSKEILNLRAEINSLAQLIINGGSEKIAEAGFDLLCPKIDSVVARSRF